MRIYFLGSDILVAIETKKLLIRSLRFLNFLPHAILALVDIGRWLDIAIESSLLRPGDLVDDGFLDFLIRQPVYVLVLHEYGYRF
jgi:hypothetical protein